MTIEKHNGKHRYSFWWKGVRHRKGGFNTKQEAQEAELKARRNLRRTNMGFIALCESRLDDVKARRTEKYFTENKKLIKKLILRWGDKKEITRKDVEEYLSSCSSNYVANKELRFIKALFNHGLERDITPENPAEKIKFFPVERKKKYIPSMSDVEKVLEIANPEQRLYLLVVMNTLGRISEVNNLKWEEVNEDYLILRTRKAKNSDLTERMIPLNQGLKDALAQIEKAGEYVFINPKTGKPYDYRKKMLAGLCKRAGVQKFGFHALRHLGASRLARAGVGLTDIQAILGHQRATTTDIYLQAIGRGVKDAMKKLDLPPKVTPKQNE